MKKLGKTYFSRKNSPLFQNQKMEKINVDPMYYVTCNKFFHNKCKYILGYKVSISSVFK
jgi:hypothetical protein